MPVLNVIFFGPSQQGKSSVITNIFNYLGQIVPKKFQIGGNMIGKTFDTENEKCFFTRNNKDIKLNIFDTVGLNESDDGTCNAFEAFNKLKKLLYSLNDGVSLLIYVKKKVSVYNYR